MSGKVVPSQGKWHGTAEEDVRAQVAYHLLKDGNFAAVLEWYRKTYPADTLDIVYQVREEAEKAADNARKYRAAVEECYRTGKNPTVWSVLGITDATGQPAMVAVQCVGRRLKGQPKMGNGGSTDLPAHDDSGG